MEQREIWNRRYAASSVSAHDPWIESYLSFFEEKRGELLVDLGCGAGENSLYLQSLGYRPVACDFSERALAGLGSVVGTRCFDMTEGLPAELYGAGIMLASLSTHYFTLELTRTLYAEIHRALTPGGYFIFRVNSLDELRLNDAAQVQRELETDYYELRDGTTKRYFSVDSMAELLGGFELLRLRASSAEYHGRRKHFIEGVCQVS